ncbi:MAG: DUF4924 family protein [Tannerella sp.]|nr:DUF4924 family protein [Tannerella sp.]
MITAWQKRKENIVEYVIGLWQAEDLVRAVRFDIGQIRRTLVDPCGQPEEVRQETLRRYEELIEMMRSEGVIAKGHVQQSRKALTALTDLHLRLLKDPKETLYGALYYQTLPHIIQLRAKSGGIKMPELETCFTALYGYLLLRLQHRDIHPETHEAIRQINTFLSHLAGKYREETDP